MVAVQSGTYRGVSAADRAAARRTRLLEATLSVWADPEVRTTMTAICASAGLSERYFYESFKNLEEAQVAVLEAAATEIETVTLRAADTAGADPAARIRASLEAFMDVLATDPRKGRVAIIEAGNTPTLRGRRTEVLRHFAHLAAAEAHDRYGLKRRERTDELAGLLFIGGMAELVTAWLEGALDATPEEMVDTASRSFLGLYG